MPINTVFTGHHCDECIYLGPWGVEGGEVIDLYIHVDDYEEPLDTLVGRYGNHPEDQLFGSISLCEFLFAIGHTPEAWAAEAIKRAIKRKILPDDCFEQARAENAF